MSKLLEHKNLIHIATEIGVLVGLTFYFSSKNKKLLEHIEDLSQRLEEQEDLIQKHDQILKQLVQVVNKGPQQQPLSQSPLSSLSSSSSSLPSLPSLPSSTHHILNDTKHVSNQKKTKTPPIKHQKFAEPQKKDEQIAEKHAEESSDDDSDLDAEIEDELRELNQQDNNLKKR